MSSKFFSSRTDKNKDDNFNTKNTPSSRTNMKRKNSSVKKSGRGR